MRGRRWLLPLLLLLPLLPACGFHPRGAAPLPSQLSRVAVENVRAGAILRTELATALESAGAKVVAGGGPEIPRVRLLSENTGRRLLSVGSGGKASEYQVEYQITFEVLKGGQLLVPPQRVAATRDYPFDRSEPLAMEAQQESLAAELRGLAVDQVVRRLRALLAAPPAAEVVGQ